MNKPTANPPHAKKLLSLHPLKPEDALLIALNTKPQKRDKTSPAPIPQ